MKPFAKVFPPSEKGWAVVIGEEWTFYESMHAAVAAAEKHNAQRIKP